MEPSAGGLPQPRHRKPVFIAGDRRVLDRVMGAGWRAILAAFDIAMQKSMREGGSLFEQFGSPHAGEHEHDDREQR